MNQEEEVEERLRVRRTRTNEMVAELSRIPVSVGVSNGSGKKPGKILKGSVIDSIGDFGARYSSASRRWFSSAWQKSSPQRHRTRTDPKDLAGPRWIRDATREPIVSDRRNSRSEVLRDSSRSLPSACSWMDEKFRHRTSVVPEDRESSREGSDYRAIHREKSREASFAGDNCEIFFRTNGDGTEKEEESFDSEEHALYSVVRKATKLPVSLVEEQREVAPRTKNRKDQELHRWLETALSNANFKMTEEEEEEEEEKWAAASMRSEMDPDARSLSGGVSFGPLSPIYRDTKEHGEDAPKDERIRERAIDVDVGSVVGALRANNRVNVEDEEREFATTSGDDSAATFVDPNAEGKMHEQRFPAPRAKWRLTDRNNEVTKNIEAENPERPEKPGNPENPEKPEKREKREKHESDGIVRDRWVVRYDRTNCQRSGTEENYNFDVPPRYSWRMDGGTSNEPHDKDSLNETGSTTGATVEGKHSGSPARGARSEVPSQQPASTNNEPRPVNRNPLPPRSLVSRILAGARSSDDLLHYSEPYSQLWIVLSNVYGELVVVLMMALCLAEVMDTPVPLLSLQSVFLMYLYVGSIAVIISIYLWVLMDSCASLASGRAEDPELGAASLTRFGSLKRAHISRARTAPTSFYIRVGALLFGLATLVFNGLEMAMHSMMQGAECLSDIIFVHPVLHGLFTFLQMHFLFVNSQVLVQRFGSAARFGFVHLAATNIAVWLRLVIWDSAQEWTYFVHLAQRGPETSVSPLNLRGFPGSLTRRARDLSGKSISEETLANPYRPISAEQISQVVTLQECLNTNTLGQLWTSSMPFLYPFIVQFSLIAAAVTFVMGQNVGRSIRYCHEEKFKASKEAGSRGVGGVGCDGSSKGLFLGILCMTAGIVVILIFLVVREDENFSPATLSWLTCGTLIGILSVSGVTTASGLVQVRRMSIVSRAPATLDNLLSNVALFGVQLYAIFTGVACACSLAIQDEQTTPDPETRGRHAMLLAASVLQLAQCFAQSTLIAETSKRSCTTRFQTTAKPARQVVTFLLFSNAVLWAFDTVVTQNWVSQELQLRFFGVLAWGIVSRICLPLVVFYRFHSCVLLLEAWNKCYGTSRGEHPLN